MLRFILSWKTRLRVETLTEFDTRVCRVSVYMAARKRGVISLVILITVDLPSDRGAGVPGQVGSVAYVNGGFQLLVAPVMLAR